MIETGSPEKTYYYHNDHLGTPQKMTDTAGVVVWEAAYLPFGKTEVNEDVDGNGVFVTSNLRFPGQYFDVETGLHYNWWRYYDAETGRYWRSDPVGLEGGINLFQYGRNNPINVIDSFGLMAFPSEAFPGLYQKPIPDWHWPLPPYKPLYGDPSGDFVIFGRWAGSRRLAEGADCPDLNCLVKCELTVLLGEYTSKSLVEILEYAAKKNGKRLWQLESSEQDGYLQRHQVTKVSSVFMIAGSTNVRDRRYEIRQASYTKYDITNTIICRHLLCTINNKSV